MSYVLSHPTDSNLDHSYSILSGCIKPNEPSPECMRKLDDIICDFLREQGVPGASLYISLYGKPIYKQGYGIKCCGELISSSSHFRIASISKVLTAIGVLRLCEDGFLSLHDKVFGENGILKRIKPKFQEKMYSDITVRDLLQHSAGWDRDLVGDHVFWYSKEDHKSSIDVWDNETLVKYALSQELSFKPGTKHAYSNLGYLVLGMVIEEVTHIPYEDYVKSILRCLDIEDIHVGKTRQDKVHYEEVKYYNNKDPQIEASILSENSMVVPQYGSFPMENTGAYGGWVTCAKNLVTLLDSLCCTGNTQWILSGESVKAMLKAPDYVQGEDWYGLGLDVEDNGWSFGHTGAMDGTSTTLHHDNSGFTWALLLNSWAKDMDLDGVIKYGLSTVQTLPLWSGLDFSCGFEENFIMSADKVECVSILLPHKCLVAHVMEMRSQGYCISWINAISLPYNVRLNIIWQKQTKIVDWSIITDIDLSSFNNCLQKMKEKWIVTALESYCFNDTVYHLFVFLEKKGIQQKVYVVDSVDEHLKCKKIYELEGYKLQSQAILQVKGRTFISAVYNLIIGETIPAKLWLDVSLEDFVRKLAWCIEHDLHLKYLQIYTTEDMPKISAVWHHSHLENNVFQRYGVTKYGFMFELRESLKCNRPVSFISAYQYEEVTYFLAVWKVEVRTNRTRSKKRHDKRWKMKAK